MNHSDPLQAIQRVFKYFDIDKGCIRSPKHYLHAHTLDDQCVQDKPHTFKGIYYNDVFFKKLQTCMG